MTDIVDNFFDPDKLRSIGTAKQSIDDYAGADCYMGYSKTGEACASLSVIFHISEEYHILSYDYAPDPSCGERINLMKILDDIISICGKVKVRKFIADPWNSSEMMRKVREKAADTCECHWSTNNVSSLMFMLKSAVDSLKVLHQDKKFMIKAITDADVAASRLGDVVPRKKEKDRAIDPLVSILMAMKGWDMHEASNPLLAIRH